MLSGFIISYIHLQDLKNKSGVVRFLRKRVTRIYPIYWIVASVMLCYYLFIKKNNEGTVVIINSISDYIYLLKCYLLLPTGTRHNFIDIAWTLNFEIFFYFVFAICIKLGFKRTTYIFWLWIVLILLKYYTHLGDFSAILNFTFHVMILYFLSGCFVAYLLIKNNKISTIYFITALVIIVVIFYFYAAFSGSVLTEKRLDINYNFLLMFTFSILLWWASTVDQNNKIKHPSNGIFLLIGNASYSIYLTHVPIIMLFYKFLQFFAAKYNIHINILAGNVLFLLAVCSCISVGILTHLFIEKPLLLFLNRERQLLKKLSIN